MMNTQHKITRGIVFIVLAVLVPTIIWIITQQLEGENWAYFIVYAVIFPLSILASVPLLIVGISYLLPNIRKSKKEKVARKCKACGSKIPANENICPDCSVLN